MIITDPLKRPSERLIQVVSNYFLLKGFVYKKSLNQFARTIGNRKEMVSIFYNRTADLVRATLTWAVLFPDLEKIYRAIEFEKIKANRETTLWTDLLNYLPRRENSDTSEFELYNSETLRYDDFSINAGAVELINSYEKYIEPYFEYYKDLRKVEKDLNELPLRHHPHIGFGNRQISLGMILGKRFDKENFSSLADLYKEYILNDDEDLEFKVKMEMYFEKTLEILNTVAIEKAIPM
jgi:hypothetical protein